VENDGVWVMRMPFAFFFHAVRNGFQKCESVAFMMKFFSLYGGSGSILINCYHVLLLLPVSIKFITLMMKQNTFSMALKSTVTRGRVGWMVYSHFPLQYSMTKVLGKWIEDEDKSDTFHACIFSSSVNLNHR
jgi:hypothetical protein